jgi:hypothetical protein
MFSLYWDRSHLYVSPEGAQIFRRAIEAAGIAQGLIMFRPNEDNANEAFLTWTCAGCPKIEVHVQRLELETAAGAQRAAEAFIAAWKRMKAEGGGTRN